MRPAVVAALAVIAATAPGPAAGHGSFPRTSTLTIAPGDGGDLYLGTTFGLLHSADDGWHWYWMCADSIGYGGTFDPKYEIAADGTIYATTTFGLRVSRDGGCSFELASAPPAGGGEVVDLWVDAVDVASDGTLWLATAQVGVPNRVWKSSDRGVTVTAVDLSSETAWWKSLKVAPSDPRRIYVTGYQLAPTHEPFVYRSGDGGETWTPLAVDGFSLGPQKLLLVEGVDPHDPDIVYVRAPRVRERDGDIVYRSDDGGDTWTPVLETDGRLTAFAIRATGDVVAGTSVIDSNDPTPGCTYRSTDRGATFTGCVAGPQLGEGHSDAVGNCVAERSDGQMFACGDNWDPDFFAVARSPDARGWAKVFRFHELAGPKACPPDTIQYTVCELEQWPALRELLVVTGPVDAGLPDGGAAETGGEGAGCCSAGGDRGAGVLAAVVVALVAAPRVRRRYRAASSSASASRQLG
jgi:hypothetical protein